MFKRYKVELDVASGRSQYPKIQVNTNDLDTFNVNFIITHNNEPVDLTGKTARIAILKPDKKTVVQDCEITDSTNGKGEVVLGTQAYVVPGTHYAEVMVYDGDNQVAVSGRFVYDARQGILNDGAIESTNEWQSINKAIADAEGVLEDLRKNGTGVDAQARADLQTVTQQLAETVKQSDTGVLDLNIFNEPSRSVLMGQEPGHINAVLGERNVKGINIDYKAVSPENTSFIDVIDVVYNLYNPENSTDGYRLTASGELFPDAKYSLSEFIPVKTGDKLVIGYSETGYVRHRTVCYDSEKVAFKWLDPVFTETSTDYATFNFDFDGYIRVPFEVAAKDKAMVIDASKFEGYKPYGLKEYKLSKSIKVEGIAVEEVPSEDANFVSDVYENIASVIGGENIVMLLPMWEESGDVVKDIVNPEIKFKRVGATMRQDGLLHPTPHFNRTNSEYFIQSNKTGNLTQNTSLPITPDKKVAQLIKPIGSKVSFIRFRLRPYGTAPTASLRVTICENSNGVPGNPIVNGTSEEILFSSVAIGQYASFRFLVPPVLKANTQYWAVLEYVNKTGIDASNYIASYYDSSGGYGTGRAEYEGSWTKSLGDMAFEVYDNLLDLDGDFSVVTAIKNEASGVDYNTLNIIGTSSTSNNSLSLALTSGGLTATTRANGTQQASADRWIQNDWHTVAMTFNQASSDNKLRLFIDNIAYGTASGYAGSTNDLSRQPLTIGATTLYNGAISNSFMGQIGPIIITKTTLTPSQIAEISFLLSSRRRMGDDV